MRTPVCKPRIGQGREGVRRKVRVAPPSQPRQTPASATERMPEVAAQPQVAAEHVSPAQTDFRQPISPRIEKREVPFYPDPLFRPPPRLPNLRESRRDLTDLDTGTNTDFEENSLFQEGIISEKYEGPDRSYIKEPPELTDLLDTTKIMQKFLPKQT